MNDIAVFTIASTNYMAYVRVLMSSIRGFHCDVDFHLILADEVDSKFESITDSFIVTEAKNIDIPDFASMAFKYNILEFNTAVKPFAFKYLFNKCYKKIIYFDPDICLYGELTGLFDMLSQYSIVLTPHMTIPLPSSDDYYPSELSCLSSGTYNLGFLALSLSDDTASFCDWWCDKCSKYCYSEVESGMFVDQKWLNLAPAYWPSLHILRHQGYNVAYWNLHERQVSGRLVNGNVPLIFYHFSGILINDLNRISKYQNRFVLSTRTDLVELYENYREMLIIHDHEGYRSARYKYGYFDDGTAIGPVARKLYPFVADRFDYPFNTGPNSYHELLKKMKLLEKKSNHMDFIEDVVDDGVRKVTYKQWINNIFKIICWLLGVSLYHFVMNYLIDNCSIRKQKFLIDK
jgi:hypothetical protein